MNPQHIGVDKRLEQLRAEPGPIVRKEFVSELRAVDEKARTVRFVITTGAIDRDNDSIDPKGWDVTDFMRSPVVLWAHDYAQPPIARAMDIVPTTNGLESTAQFPPKGTYEFADTIFDLIVGGFINASSVGFRPLEYERADDRDGINFIRQSLLEWSCVPVPANADALVVARGQGINVQPIQQWATKVLQGLAVAKGLSPMDVSLTTAPEDEAWSVLTLKDLTDKNWADLSDGEKRKIAGHFAWAASMPPQTFGDLKLGHHNRKGEIVWAGVVAATGRLNQTDEIKPDLGAVKAHLRRHYKAFSKPIPQILKSTAEEVQAMLIGKQVDAALSARLSALDSHIDAADDILDDILESLGIPDDDGAARDGRPSSPPRSGGAGDESRPLVGQALAVVAKRGRVLSAVNEGRLRTARDHANQSMEHLDAVLGQLAPADEVEPRDEDRALALTLVDDPEDVVVLTLAPDPLVPGATVDDLRESVRGALAITIESLVREQIPVALARARGRVD